MKPGRLIPLLFFFFTLLAAPCAEAADKLAVALPYLVEKIEISGSRDPVNQVIISNIAYGATRLGSEGRIELEAAESLQELEGGKKWRIRLKPDLRFANLAPVLPRDAVDSFDLVRNLTGASASAGDYTVSLVDAPGNASGIELLFELSKPQADFPLRLTEMPLIQPEVFRSFANEFGFGTNRGLLGPYQVRENRESLLTLEAVPEFYRPGIPRARFVEFRTFDTALEALSALRVGAVDIIAFPTPGILADAEKDQTLLILSSPLLNMTSKEAPWRLERLHWSDAEAGESDRLSTRSIVIRKSLRIDGSLLARFDLSGTYLP